MNTHRFLLYARKSTDDKARQIRSIKDQIAELRELAHRLGLVIVDVLEEKQTAKKPGRPIFNAMLNRIEKGEADGILAWHPDRLSRNSLDSGRIIYLLDMGVIKDLRFCTQTFEPTAQGKFNLAVMFDQAKYYVDNLSENIKRGQRQKLKDGIWPMMAPIGYINHKKDRTIVPDPDKAPLIRKAFELHATGNYTLDHLMTVINGLGLTSRPYKTNGPRRRGITPLSRSHYHRLLHNPIYCGIFRYRGELYEGRHEPIVSKALFDKVQRMMERNSNLKGPGVIPFLYRGMFRCDECAGMITMEIQKGHHYLRCTKKRGPCSQPFVREEKVSTQVDSCLQLVALPSEWLEVLNTRFKQEEMTIAHARHEYETALQRKLIDTDERLERLRDAYLEKALTLEEFRPAKEKIVHQKSGIQGDIVRFQETHETWLEPLGQFISSLSEAKLQATSENPEEKAEFLKKLGSNLTICNRTLNVEFKKPWKITEKHGRLAHNEPSAPQCGALVGGEHHHVPQIAERAGFEPALQV
jgi:site-specific DNA recombinase